MTERPTTRGGARTLAAVLGVLILLDVLDTIAVSSGLLQLPVELPMDEWDRALGWVSLAGHVVAVVGLLLRKRWSWWLVAALVMLDVVLLPVLELRRDVLEPTTIAAVGLTLLIDAGILSLLGREETRADCGIGPTPALPVKPLVVVGVLLGVVPLASTPAGLVAVVAFFVVLWVRRRRRERAG